MVITYKEKFEQLQHLLLGAYETFYVWKVLQNQEYNELYTKNNGFWSAVIPALQNEWFMGLARLFEDSDDTKSGKVISVYSLTQEHPNKVRAKQASDFIDKNQQVIQNISRFRHVHLAHNNAKFLVNRKEFETRFSIKYIELEEIFKFSDSLLGILHPEEGHSYVLDHMKEVAERDTKDVMHGLVDFDLKREESRKRWIQERRSLPLAPGAEPLGVVPPL